MFPDAVSVQPEVKYGNSRFDFYIETKSEKIFMEVKGVTLEEDGIVRFPDAPSERAVKHVEELAAARREGYRAFVMFVIQMEGVKYFTPNRETHPQFAEVLCRAAEAGVEILAFDCLATPFSLKVNRPVPIRLFPEGKAPKGEALEGIVPEGKTSEGKALEGKASEGKTPEREENEMTEAEEENYKEQEQHRERMGQKESLKKPETVNETLRKTSGKYKFADIPIPLLKWYDKNRRILPWRELPTPYRVWVSEIMLQQTRVEAVKPYFERFMGTLPDIRALADAGEETLLKLWEGLGYYNRVRNLQKAAIRIVMEYGGKMPDSYEELLKLPGIGSYTAGAIASIAFQRPVPAVDGNVMRVAARLRMDGRPITDVKVKAAVERDFKEIMPQDRPGDFNQAMMELGACVCIPNGAPLCERCPLAEACMAHEAGTEQDYPKKQPPKGRKIEEKTILLVMDQDRIAIRKRQARGLLAGMYEFPSMEGFRTAEEAAGYLEEKGLHALSVRPLEDAKHVFTHREWHMKGYMIRIEEPEPGRAKNGREDWLYIEPGETKEKYPIPSAFAAYTKYLKIRLGKNRYEEEERK